jgi:hypothetical protein
MDRSSLHTPVQITVVAVTPGKYPVRISVGLPADDPGDFPQLMQTKVKLSLCFNRAPCHEGV